MRGELTGAWRSSQQGQGPGAGARRAPREQQQAAEECTAAEAHLARLRLEVERAECDARSAEAEAEAAGEEGALAALEARTWEAKVRSRAASRAPAGGAALQATSPATRTRPSMCRVDRKAHV